MSDAPIQVGELWKKYTVVHDRPLSVKDAVVRRITMAGSQRETFWALRGVSFNARAGEALGIVGPNGSGKSTVLGILGRVLRPTKGDVRVEGRVSILMEAGVGFHPDLTGIENIYLSGALLGMRRAEIASRLDSIIEFAELRDFVDAPVRTFSSGMWMRLGFSVAVHLDPGIMLVDEVLAVGDEAFHHKCRHRLAEFRNSGGCVVFVSHNLEEVRWLCDRVLWLQEGKIVQEGPPEEVLARYQAEAATREEG